MRHERYVKTVLFRFSFLFVLGPVCVATIAGPCRKGKSYVLSEAFSQPQVFALGHHFKPETMGIWLWIAPGVFKVNCYSGNDIE